jgi:hypothetical protein
MYTGRYYCTAMYTGRYYQLNWRGPAAYSGVHPSPELIKACTPLYINVHASSGHSVSCPLMVLTPDYTDQNQDVR